MSSGRVTSLVVDPTNSSVLFAGTAGGGVWKTTNGGSIWTALTDSQPTLAVGALAIDPTGQVIYAGTGEDNYCGDCQAGQGILKSVNGGSNWTLVAGPFAGWSIGGLAVDRNTSGSSQHVLAAAGNGIWQSIDAGATWTSVSTGGATVVVQDPTTATQFWAARSDFCSSAAMGTVDVSSDGGATWRTVLTAPQKSTRVGLGVGSGGVAYAAFANCGSSNDGRLLDIEKTINNGANWKSISGTNTHGLSDYFYNGQAGQGWYDNVVAVNPANSSIVAFGGVDVLVTQDGGTNYVNVTNSYAGGYVHPDNHAIIFTPTRKTSLLWLGNDGGLWQSANLGGTGQSSDWTNLNSTLSTTQFYAGSALSSTRFLGGAQDNGSPGNLPGAAALPSWQEYFGGDGGYTAIDPTSDTIYVENQNLMISQGHSTLTSSSTSPYNSFTQASPCSGSYKNGPDPACTDPVAWAAPFLMDPANPKRLIAATNKVHETTVGGTPSGTQGYTNCFVNQCAWKIISPALTSSSSGYITSLAMGPPGQTNVIFTGSSDTTVYMTTNDGGSWTNITGNGLHGRITGIAFNPSNLAEAWVATSLNSSGVFHTINAGSSTTWTALQGITVQPNSIAVDRFNPSILYVGSDIGAVVCTTCGGASQTPNWAPFGNGLPNVQVLGITTSQDGKSIVAWTHGRGAWTIPVLPTSCLTNTVAGGVQHTLILGTDGTVRAWGGGTSGQLGNGSNIDSSVPVQVSRPTGMPLISSVAAGGLQSVARGVDGTVWAWGSNSSGGLGNANYPNGTNVPVQVQGLNGSGFLTGTASISAGDDNFSVSTKSSDGSVWAWGNNSQGELGIGNTSNSSTPVQVKGPNGAGFLTGIVQVVAGGQHVVALKGDGTVWAWGTNAYGELGIGTTSTMQSTAVQVVSSSGKGFLTGVIAVGTSSHTSLAVLTDGSVYAWGNNPYGQLGNNTAGGSSATPVQVSGLSGLTLNPSVTTGWEHSLAADPSSGSAWGWGWNVYGQVGDGSQTQRLTPTSVKTTAKLGQVAAGPWHSIALAADGAVWTWGYNYYGQLGNGSNGTTNYPTPAPVSNVSAAQRQAC